MQASKKKKKSKEGGSGASLFRRRKKKPDQPAKKHTHPTPAPPPDTTVKIHVEEYLKGHENEYSNITALSHLKNTDPSLWSVNDVAFWLDYIHLSEYRAEFMRQMVSGQELLALDKEDMSSLGLVKVGHKKKLEARIRALKHNLGSALDEDVDFGDSASENSSHSGAGSSSSAPSSQVSKGEEKIKLKCVCGDDITILRVSPNIDFENLSRKLKHEYGSRMTLKYKDHAGDMIHIRKTKDLRLAMQESGDAFKLYVTERKRHKVAQAESNVLDTLPEAVVIINQHGRVQLFNTAAEEMFGFKRKAIMGNNVTMLMPTSIAEKHGGYLQRYMDTKKGTVVGSGRVVQAKHKDGTTFWVHLSVTVSKVKGKTSFTGTLRRAEEHQEASSAEADARKMFSLLDNLLDATCVINEKGIIQFLNRAAASLFGWTANDVIGKNVFLLMPSNIAAQHDGFLKRYIDTAEAHVIGVGREVVAMKKDGTIFPIHLSLTEEQLGGGKRFFTGVMRNAEQDLEHKKSLLQQEREVLDALMIPAIIIDEQCKVHAFNQAASTLLGYKLIEVVGRNVNMLMTGEDKAKHDGYIQTYLKTGKGPVIGQGRDVVAQHKDGSMLTVHLSVTVKRDGKKWIFTGLLQAAQGN